MDQLEGDENDFDPFFSPKLRKMEHGGGDPGAPEMEPHAAARSLSAPSKPSPRLYLGWLLLRVILEVALGQLGGDENDFDAFFTHKMRKMEHASGEAGAPEMEPHAAARGLSTPSKPSPRLYLGCT